MAACVPAVETDDRAYLDAAGDVGESSSDEWTASPPDAGHGADPSAHAQGNA